MERMNVVKRWVISPYPGAPSWDERLESLWLFKKKEYGHTLQLVTQWMMMVVAPPGLAGLVASQSLHDNAKVKRKTDNSSRKKVH
jgi:hypothetical protein